MKVSAEKAFNAWLDPLQLNKWFTSSAKVNPSVGGSFTNEDGDSGEYLVIERSRVLSFSWNNQHHQPGSIVLLNFNAKGSELTNIVLTHKNLANDKEVVDLTKGWEWAISSLKSFLETGTGIASD